MCFIIPPDPPEQGDPIEPTLNSDDEEALRPKKKPKASVDKDAEKGEGKAKVVSCLRLA